MNIDKWKKKPLKKELVDIIKIQEEEISRLNREKMDLNVVIRNEKPIKIDQQGLEYVVDLEQKYYISKKYTDKDFKQEIERLNNIIKEFEEELEKERKIDRPRDDYNYGVSNTLDYMWYELQKIKGSD